MRQKVTALRHFLPKNHGIIQMAYSWVLHEANNEHSSLEVEGKFSDWVEICYSWGMLTKLLMLFLLLLKQNALGGT